MADVDEIIKSIEDAINKADEGIEDLPKEVHEEMEAVVAEARTEVAEFSKVAESLKTFPEFVKGVNVSLNKPHHSSDAKKKRAAVKAMTTVIKTETDLSQRSLDWMKKHKDDQITLGGFDVPLESVISKYLTPISEAVDAAYDIANRQDKLDGGVCYKIPTGGDMKDFLTAGDAFLKGFSDLSDFIAENVHKIPQLGTFPVKKADADLLAAQLKDAKDLPLW